MKKHANIPVFIPHLGCPNECVFCNQRSISGKQSFERASVRSEIEAALATIPDSCEKEIAFFGGSFTGIDRELMIYLLDLAQEYIDAGKVGFIRLSTRPDYINDEILRILSKYSVKTIELGLQSMDDDVLCAAKRGHDSAAAEAACRLVKQYGFELIGQMMIGLPKSTIEKEIYTAEAICRLGADGARVYPTVVFRETELCSMAMLGEYQPLMLDDAIERTKSVLDVFDKNHVKCIRVGLCSSENLFSDETVYGGVNHSAIGELAMGELFYRRMCEALDGVSVSGKNLTFYVRLGAISMAVGQKRKNIERILRKYSPNRVKVLEKKELSEYNIMIDIT